MKFFTGVEMGLRESKGEGVPLACIFPLNYCKSLFQIFSIIFNTFGDIRYNKL